MSCEQARVAISARADGEPGGPDLDRHLTHCNQCRSFEQTVLSVRRELRIAEVATTFDVSGAVLASATGAATTSDASPERSDPARPGPTRRWAWWGPAPDQRRWGSLVATVALVAAAAAIAFGAGRASGPVVVATDQSGGPSGQAPAGDSIPSQAAPDLVVVWTRDHLGPDVVELLSDRVEAMAVVRRATVGLTASWTQSGNTVDELDDGWSIPLDVIAFDPGGYGNLVGSDAISSLGDGEVLLGATSAELRGLGPGARLGFGDVELVVAGVVGDEVLGAAEAAVTIATGDRIGVVTDRYIVARFSEPADAVARWLEARTDAPVRLRPASDATFLRNADAVLPQVLIKETFGEFATRPRGDSFEVDPRWFADHIVTTELPLIGKLTCHEAVLAPLEEILTDLDGRQRFEAVITPSRFQGCWNPRYIRSTGDLSHHTWGIAVDLSASGTGDPAIDRELSEVFEDHGFTWGGAWLVADDGHFEYLEPDPGQ
jgi:hypothetical protein